MICYTYAYTSQANVWPVNVQILKYLTMHNSLTHVDIFLLQNGESWDMELGDDGSDLLTWYKSDELFRETPNAINVDFNLIQQAVLNTDNSVLNNMK